VPRVFRYWVNQVISSKAFYCNFVLHFVHKTKTHTHFSPYLLLDQPHLLGTINASVPYSKYVFAHLMSPAETRCWDVTFNFRLFWFAWTSITAYSKVVLERNGNKASPEFRSFCIGRVSDKCVLVLTLLLVSFKHNSVNLTNITGIPERIKIHNTPF
jgi:hypothetical protein